MGGGLLRVGVALQESPVTGGGAGVRAASEVLGLAIRYVFTSDPDLSNMGPWKLVCKCNAHV